MKKHFLWTDCSLLEQQELSFSELEPEVQTHLKALRPKTGDEIFLSDGKGRLSCYILQDKSTLLLSRTTQQKPKSKTVHLLLSPPKGDSLFDAIAYATQLGVDEITLFKSELCQVTEAQMSSKSLLQRIQRVSDSWAQSAERSYKVNITQTNNSVSGLLNSPRVTNTKHVVIFADEQLSSNQEWGFGAAFNKNLIPDVFFIVVGPEGGFSPKERKLLNAHPSTQPLALGPLILKVPVAVCAALTFCQAFYVKNLSASIAVKNAKIEP